MPFSSCYHAMALSQARSMACGAWPTNKKLETLYYYGCEACKFIYPYATLMAMLGLDCVL